MGTRARLTWFPQLGLSEEVKHLIESCLSAKVEERLSLAMVASHPWLVARDIPRTARQGDRLCPDSGDSYSYSSFSHSSNVSSSSSSSTASSSSSSAMSLCSV